MSTNDPYTTTRLRDAPEEPPAPPVTAATFTPTTHTTVVESGARRIDDYDDVRPWPDRIAWGPVWGGFVVAIGTYIFFQMILVAINIIDFPLGDDQTTTGIWSVTAGIVAFFLGGLVVGASTANWTKSSDGILNGIVLWALGMVGLFAIAAYGSGVAVGSFDVEGFFDDTLNFSDQDTADAAQEAAGWAILVIGLALVASTLGAWIGSMLWPHGRARIDATHDRR